MARPLILGYVRVAADSSPDDVDALHRQMADFAERAGFALGEVFVDVEASGSSAFAALIDAAMTRQADAVVVPGIEHFGRLAGVRAALQELIERKAGIRVLVMRQSSEPGPGDGKCARSGWG